MLLEGMTGDSLGAPQHSRCCKPRDTCVNCTACPVPASFLTISMRLNLLLWAQPRRCWQSEQDMAERDLEIEKLKAQIDKFKRMQFGSKSEKLGRVIEELETRLEDLTTSRGAAEMLAARAQPESRDKSSSTPRR